MKLTVDLIVWTILSLPPVVAFGISAYHALREVHPTKKEVR